MRLSRNLVYIGGMTVLVVYILNPGAGVFELIPDNVPVFGNLDEAAAVGLLIALFKKWRAPRSLPPGDDGAPPRERSDGG